MSEHDVARTVSRGFEKPQSHRRGRIVEQFTALSKNHRADEESILVNQSE
jgi:hypothetical protein